MAANGAWLDLIKEEPLEPDLPICDCHHHLWDKRKRRIESEPRYLMDEIQHDLQSGHNIVSTVYVEAESMFRQDGPGNMRPVGEVEFANGMAAMAASGLYGATRVAAGIVGYVDLAEEAGPVLDGEVAAAPERFRGIRYSAAWDPDPRVARTGRPGLYMDPVIRRGVAEVAKRDLLFEMVCRFHQIPECTDLAARFPGTRMVLNHMGGIVGIGAWANRQSEMFELWRGHLKELAGQPNVTVKLGGIGNDYCGFGWHEHSAPPTSIELAEATRPYYETTIELFGPERCMFESNFPADKISFSYAVLWNSFKRITQGFSASEKASLYHDTAARVFRLQ